MVDRKERSCSGPAAGVGGGLVKASTLVWLTDILLPGRAAAKTARGGSRCHETLWDDTDPGVDYEEISFDNAIGTGSFGAVWKGRCRGDVVAVKACKVGDAHDSNMLLREIRYLQRLRHPRLVSFLGFCNRPPHIHLIMEFMPGGSLHAALFGPNARRTRLSFERKVRMALQVSEGLSYLHQLQVVHRDLKTMNIVMDLELNCKLCDFGLTVTLEKSHLTVRHIQGSPRYMAPEQFEAAARITEKVDIWQMGCVMLELFCHSVPFKSASGVHQIASELLVKRRPPQCPSQADPHARVLVQSCLRIDPKQRPWAETLEEALTGVLGFCREALADVAGGTKERRR